MSKAWMLAGSLTLVVLAAGLDAKAAGPLDALRGRYAFDWLQDSDKSECVAIDRTLLATLESSNYVCGPKEETNSASRAPFVRCVRKGGGAEYLIFKTRALCDNERQTQAANDD